jgi:hypothetical protein
LTAGKGIKIMYGRFRAWQRERIGTGRRPVGAGTEGRMERASEGEGRPLHPKSILDQMGAGKKKYDDPLTPVRPCLELVAAGKEVGVLI